jgi:hypothetical protein
MVIAFLVTSQSPACTILRTGPRPRPDPSIAYRDSDQEIAIEKVRTSAHCQVHTDLFLPRAVYMDASRRPIAGGSARRHRLARLG